MSLNLKKMLYSLEKYSNHPIAKTITEELEDQR
jgi:cation transport ATPase